MSERLIIILTILFMGAGFYGSAYAGYRYYKKNYGEWEREKEKVRKMSWLEISLRGGAILIASTVLIIRYFITRGADFLSIGGLILVILVITLNIVIKRGGSVAVLIFAIITALYVFLIGMMVGIPAKAPVFTVNATEIKLAHTTAGELMDAGFDIYIRKDEDAYVEYGELLSSGIYQKYPVDGSAYVEKGFRRNNYPVVDAPYLLAKDGVILGAIGLYGDADKDIVLENCKVLHIRLNEDSIKAIRANAISCKLNDFDLLAPLNVEGIKKAFGSNLWFISDQTSDAPEMQYGIHWPAPNNSLESLFWNTYHSSIKINESYSMTDFELSTQLRSPGSAFLQ